MTGDLDLQDGTFITQRQNAEQRTCWVLTNVREDQQNNTQEVNRYNVSVTMLRGIVECHCALLIADNAC